MDAIGSRDSLREGKNILFARMPWRCFEIGVSFHVLTSGYYLFVSFLWWQLMIRKFRKD